MKILIVDDEMMTKEWLKLTIASLPFTITQLETASNGEEALSKIADNHFDLIFIDVMMPKMNGLELLKRINELGSEAMLVVLSSHDEFKFAKEAIKYNVTEYVLKNECSREKLTELLHACEESIDNKKSVGNLHEELMHKVIHNNIQNSSIQFIERLFIQAEGEVMCVVVIRGGAEFLPPVYEKQKVVITCQGLIGRTELHASNRINIFMLNMYVQRLEKKSQWEEALKSSTRSFPNAGMPGLDIKSSFTSPNSTQSVQICSKSLMQKL